MLVAEDNKVNQMLIRKLLVHHGHQVRFLFPSGRAAEEGRWGGRGAG